MTENENGKVRLLSYSRDQKEPELKPIVLKLKKKKKNADSEDGGKEKYTPWLEDIQRFEGNAVRIAQKTTRALSKGMETYERERQQSAKAKKDGAIEDFVHNSAKATSASLKEASDLPIDFAESMNMGSYNKRLRQSLRQASKLVRTWRL
jgi:hypothetical protein